MLLITRLSLFLAAIALLTPPAAAAPDKPNVVIIYTDDMGYADISSFAQTKLPVLTPNIDRISQGGTRFTQFYVSTPICSPSRAALLSGRFSARTGLTNFLQAREGNFSSDANDYMEPRLAYMPKTFQGAGYHTAHVGKWHLGGGRDVDNAPTIRQYGYNEAYSTWESPNPDPAQGIRFAPWDYNNLEPGQIPRHQRTQYMVDKTLAILQRNPEKPCFITLWPDDLHTPFVPTPAMRQKYGGIAGQDNSRENFYGVLEEYDRQIGRFLDGLDHLGITTNTIVIFTGDNGPAPDFGVERTDGMRGRKLSLYEGGIRMPFIVRWPGQVPASSVNSTIVAATDLLPTLTSLAGIPLSAEAAADMDGENLATAFRGFPFQRLKPLFWEYGRTSTVPRPGTGDTDRSPVLAMREGVWKLLTAAGGGSRQLYNVSADPNETTNLNSVESARAIEMSTRLQAWKATLPGRTQPYPAFAPVNFNQYSITEIVSAEAIRIAAGAEMSKRLDGVTVAPNGADFIYVAHIDNTDKYTFLQINPVTGQIDRLLNSQDIKTQAAIGAHFVMDAGFEYSPGGDRLFLTDYYPLEETSAKLLSIDIGTTTARVITSVAGLTDLSVLPNGTVAVAEGENGGRRVGTIEPFNGSYTQRITEAQLRAASPGTPNLPPSAIAVNATNGEAWIAASGDADLFHLSSLTAGGPAITRQTQEALSNAYLLDVTIDQAGNVFGWDSYNLYAISGTDGSVTKIPTYYFTGQIPYISPGRSLAARMVDPTHTDVYLTAGHLQEGLFRIRFGNIPSAVGEWALY